MFMSDVSKTEEIKSIATSDLRKLGVKCRIPKKIKPVQSNKDYHTFKEPLSALSMQIVTLRTGQQIIVPEIIHEMCSYITPQMQTAGIFRQEGSKQRQMEIKSLISSNKMWNKRSFTAIEMGATLKMLLRDLPEPLIPFAYHELFLRCILLDSHKLEALLLACLFLPTDHLNTLSYLMQFFQEVSSYSPVNKMTAFNLAVCIGPTIFPVGDKYAPDLRLRTSKTCELTEMLINNATVIGVLPENVIDRIGKNAKTTDDVAKKTKRRSGSLTRMFNGLKKIVVGKNEDNLSNIVTPDLLLTPINRSIKKRRIEQASGLSTKKKNDLLNKLPDNKLLNKPFTPVRTPVNMNLNGASDEQTLPKPGDIKEKKWYLKSIKSAKNLKQDSNKADTSKKSTKIERRWSAIGQIKETVGNPLQKVHSSPTIPKMNKKSELDYVRVPKVEYEEIKNRVTAIERRISYELENVQSKICNESEKTSNINNVQTAYEQTLQQANLSPTTDQLAKRLSRELKIRRKSGNGEKIIRSPSARKIGSMRRRSQEKLTRHQSWHLGMEERLAQLKRGKPVAKRKSLEPPPLSSAENVELNRSGSSSEKWQSAEGYFFTSTSSAESDFIGRASIAKLRNENAGMVLAKAKLFDDLSDEKHLKQKNKIGLRTNHFDNKQHQKFKTDARMVRKSISPKCRRNFNNKQMVRIARHVVSRQKSPNFTTPNKMTPVIKKSLTVKSPKRLCRTPGFDRNTPLKVLNAQQF